MKVLLSILALITSLKSIAQVQFKSTGIGVNSCSNRPPQQNEIGQFQYVATCPGQGDYRVEVKGSYPNYSVFMTYKDHSIAPPDLDYDYAPGEIMEWRYLKTQRKRVDYFGAIYRIIKNEDKSTEWVVVRLKKKSSCVIAIAEELSTARNLADDPFRDECL